MSSRFLVVMAMVVSLVVGCSYSSSLREYREEKIRMQYPQWDDTTVQRTAARKVEIGMNQDMVSASFGSPDSISREGDGEKWGYAIFITQGDGPTYKKFVYFVYFRNGLVVRTEGDRKDLQYLHWYE